MKWWTHPKQRQRWHSTEILPPDSDEWGHIFFDLFFVGGAYNLGNVLKNSRDLNFHTLLYFFATGFPCMVMWSDKLYFDARFTTRPGRDVFHRSLEVLELCCVATALSRIRSVEVESHPCMHLDVFEFALAALVHSFLTIVRYVEVVLFVEGDPGARVAAKRDVMCRILPLLFLLAATVESGKSSFGSWGEHGEGCEANERPMSYCLVSWLSGIAIGCADKVLFAPKGERKHIEETSVPLNVHFCMHRYGEWFMLMFGESIMSLLIVEGNNETLSHNLKFYAGILSVIFLANSHFKSEPGHHDDHALSRSRWSNYLYTAWFVPMYSMTLIAAGISYKMFLYNYDTGENNYNRRNLGGEDKDYDSQPDGGNKDSYDEYLKEREQDTAGLFTGSLMIVLVCDADISPRLHQGRKAIRDQNMLIPTGKRRFLRTCKVLLLIFLAVMSQIESDPTIMAMFGLAAIMIKDTLRKLYRIWQEKEVVTSRIDKDGTHINSPGADMDDDDYPYQIERFKNADAALAKFEQESVVEESEDEAEDESEDESEDEVEDEAEDHYWGTEVRYQQRRGIK